MLTGRVSPEQLYQSFPEYRFLTQKLLAFELTRKTGKLFTENGVQKSLKRGEFVFPSEKVQKRQDKRSAKSALSFHKDVLPLFYTFRNTPALRNIKPDGKGNFSALSTTYVRGKGYVESEVSLPASLVKVETEEKEIAASVHFIAYPLIKDKQGRVLGVDRERGVQVYPKGREFVRKVNVQTSSLHLQRPSVKTEYGSYLAEAFNIVEERQRGVVESIVNANDFTIERKAETKTAEKLSYIEETGIYRVEGELYSYARSLFAKYAESIHLRGVYVPHRKAQYRLAFTPSDLVQDVIFKAFILHQSGSLPKSQDECFHFLKKVMRHRFLDFFRTKLEVVRDREGNIVYNKDGEPREKKVRLFKSIYLSDYAEILPLSSGEYELVAKAEETAV